MATITFDLKAITGSFTTDLQRASREAQKSMKEIQASINETAAGAKEGILDAVRSLTGLSPAQLGLGALAAGLGEVTKQAIETGDKLNKMAQKVGIGVESLQGLVYAAQLADVNMESLGTGLGKFDKAISQAAGGSKEQAAAFAAMGVSLTDANGKMKSTETLLGEVSDKFKGYQDGANKTALAMALFGKAGADLIPFLNEGSKEIARMSDEAKQLGLDFAAIAKPSEEFNDNLTRLKDAAVGVGVDIAKELLPVLIEAEQKILDFIKSARESGTLQELAAAIGFVVKNLDTLAVMLASRLAIGAAIAAFEALVVAVTSVGVAAASAEAAIALLGGPAGILAIAAGAAYYLYTQEDLAKTATDALRDATNKLTGASAENLPSTVAEAQGAYALAQARLKAAEAALAQLEAEKKLSLDSAEASAGTESAQYMFQYGSDTKAVDNLREHISQLRDQLSDSNTELSLAQMRVQHLGKEAQIQAPNVTAFAKAMGDDAVKAAQKLAEMLNKDGDTLASLRGKLDPTQKMYQEYVKVIVEAQGAYQKEIDLANKQGASKQVLAQIEANLFAKREQGLAVLNAETAAYLKQNDVVGKYLERLRDDAALVGLSGKEAEIAKAIQDTTRAWNNKTEAEREWLRVHGAVDPTTQSGIDLIRSETGALYDSKQAWDAQKQAIQDWQNIWKQAGEGVASTFADILVNGGSLFDGLVNLAKQTVQQIIQYFVKLAIINPILNSIFGGQSGSGFNLLPTLFSAAGGGGDAGGTGGISSLFSASSWVNAGKNLWSGFSTTFGGLSSSGSIAGGGSYSLVPLNANGTPIVAGYQSSLGQAFGVAGGIYAGYNAYQNAGGGVAGAAAGAAYGYGTYVAGAAISTGVAAGSLAAGFAAIPVVGWIALAAMAIDALSGGNLFGTAAKPTGNTTQNIILGQESASVQNQYETKKKGALFSGNSYSWKDFAATDDQTAAASALFSGILKSVTAGADALGGKVGTLITGSFYQKFDKDGKVLDAYSTVLGQKYKETMQQFAERITAENLLALLPAAQNASKIADQWRSSADLLLDGTTILVQAQMDINNGIGLLGSDDSLSNISDEVKKLGIANESLTQTYVRLQTEQTTLQARLDMLGLQSGKTGKDFLEFADALTTAAGGLDNLQAAWNTYYDEYYSDAEKQANTMSALNKRVADSFKLIGEDPTESMAKFRQDFEAAMPNLTPQQVLQWIAAGDALAKLNQALGTTAQQAADAAAAQAAAQQSYDQFIAQFDPKTLGITDFEKSMIGLHGTLTDNIQKANDLAKAAGLAGASQEDIGKIIQASAQAGVDALKAFEDQTAQLAAKLYGTNIDQLTKQLTDLQNKQAKVASDQNYALEAYFGSQIPGLQKQIDDANAQAEALQRLTDATALLSNLGQIGSVTGQSLDELAKQFSIPLDKFAQDLGLSTDDLNKQFQQAELQAQAAIKANDYLREILNVLQGKSANTPIDATSPIIGDKPVPQTATVPAVSLAGTPTVAAPEMTAQLKDVSIKLEMLLRGIADGTLATQEGTRSIVGALTNRSVQPQPMPRTVRTAVL